MAKYITDDVKKYIDESTTSLNHLSKSIIDLANELEDDYQDKHDSLVSIAMTVNKCRRVLEDISTNKMSYGDLMKMEDTISNKSKASRESKAIARGKTVYSTLKKIPRKSGYQSEITVEKLVSSAGNSIVNTSFNREMLEIRANVDGYIIKEALDTEEPSADYDRLSAKIAYAKYKRVGGTKSYESFVSLL